VIFWGISMPVWMAVEDEADIHDVMLGMFEVWGITGVSFIDSAEAIAWVEQVDQGQIDDELPELAIVDIRLPGLSGLEVSRRIRASKSLAKIAIVLTTAYSLPSKQQEDAIRQAQADALIYKPLPAMPQLRQFLNDVIAQRAGVQR
jgi:CheY-like chemotaxis protein